ncbi:uncharacterized protein LOC134824270 [Bolinopsis microptera]|uniref:uncharacterized protein LOC134824270 n=1 Tax=Bolinopsis microptera TaxID=2820187 RepID=UPI003079C39D
MDSDNCESLNDHSDAEKEMNSDNCESLDDHSDSEEEMNVDVQEKNEYNFGFFEKLLSVLSLTVRKNLSHTAVDELLHSTELYKGVNLEYKELESVYQMRRYIDRNMLRPKVYYLCPSSNCSGSYLEESVPNSCTQEDCNETLVIEKLRKKGQYFLYTPLATQIKQILEIVEMEKIMSDYLDGAVLQGMQCYPNSLRNIFSSKRYQELKLLDGREKFDPRYNLLTLSLNLDGVETAKSASNSLYPVQVIINEMPEYVRRKLILCPELFLKNKSNDTDFNHLVLKPLVLELRKLNEEGVEWYSSLLKRSVRTRVLAFSMNADSVMKPELICIPGHAGKYSCPVCTKQGKSTTMGKGSTTVQVPEVDSHDNLVTYPLRSVSSIEVGEYGYEGYPLLTAVPEFPVFKCHSIDYMNCITLGVFAKIFRLIMKTVGGAGELRVAQATVNIKGYTGIEHGPRCTSDFAHYKSSEWRDWGLLFFPKTFEVLIDEKMLQKEFFENFIDLTVGMSLLLSDDITEDNLVQAEKFLNRFFIQFCRLYGEKYCGFNFHLITHLVEKVRYLGPLWATSLFIHEGFNQTLLKCYRPGTSGLKQMAERLQLRLTVLQLFSFVSAKKKDSIACKLAERVWFPLEQPEIDVETSSLFKSVTLSEWNVCQEVKVKLTTLYNADISDEVVIYDRVKYKRDIFSTGRYSGGKNSKRIDHFIYCKDSSQFGRIDDIIVINDETFITYARLVVDNNYDFNIFPSNIRDIPHIKRCQATSETNVLKLSKTNLILKKCICLTLKDNSIMLGYMPFPSEAS